MLMISARSPREIMNQMMRLVDEKLDPRLKVRHVGISAIRLVEESYAFGTCFLPNNRVGGGD